MDSFVLYTDQIDVIKKLTDEQAGILLKSLYYYAETGQIPELDTTLDLVITPFITTINRDKKKYDRRCETSAINGRLGGRPKKPNENLTKPKKADSDSVSDSDSNSDIEKEKSKKKKFGEYKNVLLAEKELQSLVRDYGDVLTNQSITYLDEYIEMKGYKAKSHYLCIRKWVVKAVKEHSKGNSKLLLQQNSIPDWFNKDVQLDKPSQSEQREMQTTLSLLEEVGK